MSNSIVSNRSTLKEFLASVATIQGDLSNITAPPFVLAEFSTVELPQYYADNPSLFVAPALEKDEEKRALLVLKNFLGSLRNQQYAGRKVEDGVKKPLNAFLGELFLGSWKDDSVGETRLISEQVSHHPPITACYLWNDKHGVRAEGFTQQEITFSGSVNIKQKGYAITHIDKYNEDYLIPMPNMKITGILGGRPYPELVSSYSIISSNGIVSEIKFQGKSLMGFGRGSKNSFEARMYRTDTPKDNLYTAKGSWTDSFSIFDGRSGREIEHFDVNTQRFIPLTVADPSEQDPWESRRAWSEVLGALRAGDMKGTTKAKSTLEDGQRNLRHDEKVRGEPWQPLFFRRKDSDPIFDRLSAFDKRSFIIDPEGGIWKVDRNAVANAKRPYHGALLPTGQMVKTEDAQAKEGLNHSGNSQHTMETNQHLHNRKADSVHSSSERTESFQKMDLYGTKDNQDQETISNAKGDELHAETISDSQIEAMLRAKYQSAPR